MLVVEQLFGNFSLHLTIGGYTKSLLQSTKMAGPLSVAECFEELRIKAGKAWEGTFVLAVTSFTKASLVVRIPSDTRRYFSF